MRELKPINMWHNQRVFSHKGRTYSIVDLCDWPEDAIRARMTQFYKPYNFELADITGDKVDVIGRFKSVEEAQDKIKSLVKPSKSTQKSGPI